MGSTRFLKVARARSEEGLVVVKVFVRHDPSISLLGHEEKLEHIKIALDSSVNCLPFKIFFVTDRAGFVIREYVKHNLYDRLSTRPFLTLMEKKWITFQILYALHQCHKQKICHGDIKVIMHNLIFHTVNIKYFFIAGKHISYFMELGAAS